MTILKDFEKKENYSFSGKAIVHCFTSNAEELKEIIEAGYYVGITGWICDERKPTDLDDAIKSIDLCTFLNRVMIETDAPCLVPRTIKPRPEYALPEHAIEVAKKLAEILNVEYDVLVKASYDNCRELFRLI
jgi:TatD DNase family protein